MTLSKQSSIILVIIVCIFYPTLSADSAFYLTKLGALRSLTDNIHKNIWSVSYGGLIEYCLRLLISNTIVFILTFKIFVTLINYILFLKIFSRNFKIGTIEILSVFFVLQLYLAPSEYSFAVGGLSAVIISSNSKQLKLKLLYGGIAIILLGFDFPNPKYLGLGLMLFLGLILLKNERNLKKEIIFIFGITIAISAFLIYKFNSSGYITPPDYTIKNSNGELLDLAGRGFIEAIIPYKNNKIFYPIYISMYIWLLFNISILLRNQLISNRVVVLITLSYIFSFGILEPTGILLKIVEINPMLSFVRTRAGFDLIFFIYIYYIRIYYSNSNINKLNEKQENQFKSFITILLISTILLFLIKNTNNLSQIKTQSAIIDDLQKINNFSSGCYYHSSKGYTVNPVFGFGPHLIRLATNFIMIDNEYDYNKNKVKCNILITDKSVKLPRIISLDYNFQQEVSEYYLYYKVNPYADK